MYHLSALIPSIDFKNRKGSFSRISSPCHNGESSLRSHGICNLKVHFLSGGRMVVRWVALLHHSKKARPSFTLRLFCLVFVYSPCACVGVGFLQALWRPPTVQRSLLITSTGKLTVGVSVSGCQSMCVSPAIGWRPSQGVPLPLAP